jgi:GR25 family glycosyltransferase involved in LPS biosynthesis
LSSSVDTQKKFETFVINLDSSTERMSNFVQAFEGKLNSFVRISACRGSTIPRLAESMLTTKEFSSTGRGALGTSLSHISVWEKVVSEGIDNALVLEDDAVPLFSTQWTFEHLGLPTNYDLCFVNCRMLRGNLKTSVSLQEHKFVSCFDAMVQFSDEDNAPGADGYIISAAAAQKLLAWFNEDKFGSFLDWRLVAYCLNVSEIGDLPDGRTAKAVLKILGSGIKRDDRLEGYVMCPPLVDTLVGPSDVWQENNAR